VTSLAQVSFGLASATFSICLLFDHEDGSDIFLRNVGRSELHGITTQKTVLSNLRPCAALTVRDKLPAYTKQTTGKKTKILLRSLRLVQSRKHYELRESVLGK
jgi:hypothetical protein